MNAVALIPARGGSKGIPRKNILPIGGKPLIVWTIQAAQGCHAIDRVVVSSDDDEILAVAAKSGAEALKRPEELAGDTAGPKPVLKHTLEAVAAGGELPKWVVYLQPTSPLRTARHLTEAFALLEKDASADALVSVYEVDNASLKASTKTKEGYLAYASGREYANMNRQTLPKLYMPNGAIYIMRSEDCIKNPRFDGERTLGYVMSAEESIDLDTPEDIPAIEAALAAHGA